MCNACALLDCRLTIIELTVDYGFHEICEFRNFSVLNHLFLRLVISNGNRTEWSPIRSVIIRVITKSVDCAAGVRFVHHEYDYRLNWMTQSLITN